MKIIWGFILVLLAIDMTVVMVIDPEDIDEWIEVIEYVSKINMILIICCLGIYLITAGIIGV